MCWLDAFYRPETGAPSPDLVARIVKDHGPEYEATREREHAAERVDLKRRLRLQLALNERLLNEIEEMRRGR